MGLKLYKYLHTTCICTPFMHKPSGTNENNDESTKGPKHKTNMEIYILFHLKNFTHLMFSLRPECGSNSYNNKLVRIR